MKRFKVWVSGLSILLSISFGFWASAQEVKPAAKPSATASKATKHSLWKVEGKKCAVYLLGSVHVLKSEDYPLPAPINLAFSNSAIVAFETDIAALEDPAMAMKMLGKSRLPEGETLETQLSPEVYKAFMKHVREAGVPEMMVEQLKPAMAAMIIAVLELSKLGLEPEKGLDKHFFKLAKETAKEIIPLEAVEFQINLISDFSKEEGEAMMKTTLKNMDTIKSDLAEMLTAWRTGNAEALDKFLNEAMADSPAIYKRLVTDRNRNWLPKVEEFLKGDKNAIVIVGAAHLVGKEGVVHLIKEKGYKVVQE
jgi:uncharacterized protein YbaP (TraB family)